MLKRIQRIRSHVGHARFLMECDPDPIDTDCAAVIGVIPRQTDIPSPYAYSPEWSVYRHDGKNVIIRETSHRCYDVFEVPAEMIQHLTTE